MLAWSCTMSVEVFGIRHIILHSRMMGLKSIHQHRGKHKEICWCFQGLQATINFKTLKTIMLSVLMAGPPEK